MLSLVDFTEKVVLDVGSGTGRLAYIITPKAKAVYAIEPVDNLRSYIRFKAERMNIHNLYAVDGRITRISFEDGFIDVTKSSFVILRIHAWPSSVKFSGPF